MNFLKILLILLVITIALTACNKPSFLCPGEAIEWVDLLMIDGVKYYQSRTNEYIPLDKGDSIGEVTFTMSDNACSDHVMKNGHAAYLPKGTTVHEVEGYPASFMVLANDKVYLVEENKRADTVEELYPIADMVKKISIVSTIDGSELHTFSMSSQTTFLDAWMSLELEDRDKLYDNGSFEGEQMFLEILLKNGISMRVVYRVESNTFHLGAIGNDEIKAILLNEKTNID
ncbi:hypothetical protein ACFQ3N_19330 [Virgibacillus byunsanensis]|uniref:Uncharacterized protein n=1 Tax=Virgibacillus byunsanensis TaxID=570945 RepID=A0ABW3LR09_9BACI